jgi:apolipoprotein N-acyltransferase
MMNLILALPVPIAGILASFALPPIHFLPLLVALSYPIARMLSCQNMRSAFWVGWGCGLGWFLVSLYWISNAMLTGGSQFYWMIPFAMFFLPSFLAIFWGLAFALAWRTGTSPAVRWGGGHILADGDGMAARPSLYRFSVADPGDGFCHAATGY